VAPQPFARLRLGPAAITADRASRLPTGTPLVGPVPVRGVEGHRVAVAQRTAPVTGPGTTTILAAHYGSEFHPGQDDVRLFGGYREGVDIGLPRTLGWREPPPATRNALESL
jgi:hypothetical protein